MGRILFFILLALLIYIGIRRIIASQMKGGEDHEENKPSKPGRLTGEQMVQCENCGVYVSESEAVKRGGHYFCSEEHAKEGVKQ